jgi:hypothetical protein
MKQQYYTINTEMEAEIETSIWNLVIIGYCFIGTVAVNKFT